MAIPTINEIVEHCKSIQCSPESVVHPALVILHRCPKCGASPYSRCHGPMGQAATASHIERVYAAIQYVWPIIEVV